MTASFQTNPVLCEVQRRENAPFLSVIPMLALSKKSEDVRLGLKRTVVSIFRACNDGVESSSSSNPEPGLGQIADVSG